MLPFSLGLSDGGTCTVIYSGASMLPNTIAIPFHQSFATLKMSQHDAETTLTNLKLSPPPLRTGLWFREATGPIQRPQYDSLTIDGTRNELIIQGPGKFTLTAEASTAPLHDDVMNTIVTIQARLRPIDFEHAINIAVDLLWDKKDWQSGNEALVGRWTMERT